MATFDVRSYCKEVDDIVFADACPEYRTACRLSRDAGSGSVVIQDTDVPDEFSPHILSKLDAVRMIHALEKAIELNWWDK